MSRIILCAIEIVLAISTIAIIAITIHDVLADEREARKDA